MILNDLPPPDGIRAIQIHAHCIRCAEHCYEDERERGDEVRERFLDAEVEDCDGNEAEVDAVFELWGVSDGRQRGGG